jgi:GntR family transcriptional regulator
MWTRTWCGTSPTGCLPPAELMAEPSEKPVLRIDLCSSTPVYRQILDGLRALLVSDMFHPGDKLPTVREMAIDLGVNHNTVAEAYRLLADEGWLDLKRHHGATVLSREPQRAGPERRQDFAQRLQELAASAIADGVDKAAVVHQLNTLADQLKTQKECL